MSYPSGRVVKTTQYASGFWYTPHGAVKKMRLGNGLWEHTAFNSRLQPIEIGLGVSAKAFDKLQLSYDYGTQTQKNGNVVSQTITVPAIVNVRQQLNLKQTYTYDSLNRLASAREVDQLQNNTQTFKQTYSYTDANGQGGKYGNLRLNWGQTTSNVRPQDESQIPAISSATNRITSSGYSYDAAGNLTGAPDKVLGAPGHLYSFDGENRMISYDASTELLPHYRPTPLLDSTKCDRHVHNCRHKPLLHVHVSRLNS